MYFTKFSETDGGEKIYQANYISGSGTQGEWSTDLQPLAFCAGKSTYTHPALSADGGIMIFASDMTASLGGMDLFLTRKDGERWSDPVNLGAAINTKSNELFPFLDSKNNLFFSSDGQPGLGGYDVFMCKFNGKTWNMPINLTKYINTEDDDVAFTVSRKDGNSAFYTTKVKSGKRAMQLKRVTLNNKLVLNNLASLSDVFTSMALSDKASPEMIIAAVTEPVRIIPVKSETKTEVIKKENDVKGQQKINPVEIKKEDRSVEIPVKTVSKPEKKQVPTSGTQVKPADAKVETIKVAVPEPAEKKDVVVYRIQIISSGTAKGNYQITINGKSYSTFEYFYNGGYRTCVGKFSTLASATELQRICRKSGYAQAFIVAFKNNVRSTDPALFK